MSHNLLVWISDKTSKCHLYSHRGTRMGLIVWVFNGLFATQPNNCTIFPMYLPLCLCFPFWSSAYWQMHRLKRRKMTNQILGIWTLFIFIFFQGLLLYQFPWNQLCVHLPPSPWAPWMLFLPHTRVSPYTTKLKLLKSHLLKWSVTMFLDFFLLP